MNHYDMTPNIHKMGWTLKKKHPGFFQCGFVSPNRCDWTSQKPRNLPGLPEARFGHSAVVNFLLEEGAEVNQCDCQHLNCRKEGAWIRNWIHGGCCPLMNIIYHYTIWYIIVIIPYYTTLYHIIIPYYTIFSHILVNVKLIEPSCYFPSSASDVDLRGATALIWAAREGREALVQRLIKANADIQKAKLHELPAVSWRVEHHQVILGISRRKT